MKETGEGLPWWPSGKDPVLPMQGAQVRSLVKELRSHISCSMAKKKKKKKKDSGKIYTYRIYQGNALRKKRGNGSLFILVTGKILSF